MTKTEDGNVQDISVHDKDNATLGATEEAQDMSLLNHVTVPMPAFVNPRNPGTAAGSVNLSLESHPVPHSEDFGAMTGTHVTRSPLDEGEDAGLTEDEQTGHPGGREAAKSQPDIEYPEDRNDWQKKHWQSKAREYGLPVSGNTEAVEERVKEYEDGIELAKTYRAGDWINDIKEAETTDDLDEIKALYDRSGAEFSTVQDAFEKRASDLSQ